MTVKVMIERIEKRLRRAEHQRNADDEHAGQLGRQGEQIDDAADPGGEVAQRDRHARADHLLEDRGVGGQARGDLGRPVLLEEARRQSEQILLHRDAQVGDGSLADPRHEEKAQRGRRGEHHDDHQQIVKGRADGVGGRAVPAEALVDDALEAVGDRQSRRRRQDEEESRGGDVLRIFRRMAPDEAQIADLRAAVLGVAGHGADE
jgi:hypothetical protein